MQQIQEDTSGDRKADSHATPKTKPARSGFFQRIVHDLKHSSVGKKIEFWIEAGSLGAIGTIFVAYIYNHVDNPKIIYLLAAALTAIIWIFAIRSVRYFEAPPTTQPTTVSIEGAGNEQPTFISEERDRLCRAIGSISHISSEWMTHRWNQSPTYHTTLNDSDWASHSKIQHDSIDEIRELVKAGADRWISPTLGTPPGQWTTNLLTLIREIEPHLYVTNPAALQTLTDEQYESVAQSMRDKGKVGITAEQIKNESVSQKASSEQTVLRCAGQLQKMCTQLVDADITHLDRSTNTVPADIKQRKLSQPQKDAPEGH